MLLELFRKKSNGDTTIGELSIDGAFQCYTLEDEKREIKVMGETRIPAGTYKIKLQQNGTMTGKYAKRFPGIHQGMLWLQDVPNFTTIYIHIGNTDDDTKGCILVGKHENNWKLSESTNAYIPLYVKIVQALNSKEKVSIKIIDEFD
jgi:hypothetical protein